MIGVDTNLLVYSHRRDSRWHRPALACVRGLVEGSARWALPWPCVHEFLGVVTRPKLFNPPTELSRALDQVEQWLGAPAVTMLGEGPRYWPQFRALALGARVAGPMVHDARIAALCRLHGVTELWSADRDFSRFPGLRVVNPLQGNGGER